MENRKFGFATIIFAAFLLFVPQNAAAQTGEGDINYRFKRGDTLIELAQKYFRKPQQYRIVQRQNRIANPRRIPVGTTIRISRHLLKYAPSRARLVSVRGRVLRSGARATGGDLVGEGTSVTTAASSFVSLALEDGSTVSLASNSSMRIRRLRRYLLGGSLDYDFDVVRGSARSKVRPKKSQDDRYRMRSRKSVSAVRGTDFQVRNDEASDRDFAEVVEGGLAVDAGGKSTSIPAGNGLAIATGGVLQQEKLLPPPALIEPGKTQTGKLLNFSARPASGEAGYRFIWAADAGFVDVIADRQVSEPAVMLESLDNGNYFVRARAVSGSGIQGMPATFAFRRRLNDVKADAGPSDDGFAFKWTGYGDGIQRFHFQLFKDSAGNVPMIDETGLETNRVAISDLPPGDYYWRVGVVQFLDGEVSTSWTKLEKISLTE